MFSFQQLQVMECQGGRGGRSGRGRSLNGRSVPFVVRPEGRTSWVAVVVVVIVAFFGRSCVSAAEDFYGSVFVEL